MRSPPPSGPPPPTNVEGPATGGKRPTYQNGRRHVPRDVGGAGDNAELPGHSCSPPPHRHTMHAAACQLAHPRTHAPPPAHRRSPRPPACNSHPHHHRHTGRATGGRLAALPLPPPPPRLSNYLKTTPRPPLLPQPPPFPPASGTPGSVSRPARPARQRGRGRGRGNFAGTGVSR